MCVETEPADMAFSAGSLPPSSRRDRTSEFHAIADRLRKSTQLSSSANGSTVNGSSSATTSNGHHHHEQPSRLHRPESVGSTQSEFNRRASRIGLSIHQTSQKLSKLTKCKVTTEEETLLRIIQTGNSFFLHVFFFFFFSSTGSWRSASGYSFDSDSRV